MEWTQSMSYGPNHSRWLPEDRTTVHGFSQGVHGFSQLEKLSFYIKENHGTVHGFSQLEKLSFYIKENHGTVFPPRI
jgi:hypothetical protein